MAEVDLCFRGQGSDGKGYSMLQSKEKVIENELNRVQRCLSYRFEVVIAKNLVVE